MKIMLLATLASRVFAPAVMPDGRALEGDYRGIAVDEAIVDITVGRIAPTMCGPRAAPTVALGASQGDVNALAIIDDNASVIRLPAAAISQPVASADCQTFTVVLADGSLARVGRSGDVVTAPFVTAPDDLGEWSTGLPLAVAGATCATAAPGGMLARTACDAPRDGVVLDTLDGQRIVGLLAGDDDDVIALTDVGSVWLASGTTVVKLAEGQAAGVAILPAGDDVLVVRRDGSVTALSSGRAVSLGGATAIAPLLLQHGAQRQVVAAVGATVAVVDVDTGASDVHYVAAAPMGHLLLGTSLSPYVAAQVSSQESQVVAINGALASGSMPVSGAVVGDTDIHQARALSVALRPVAAPADRVAAIDAVDAAQQGLSCSGSSSGLPSLALLAVFMVLLLQRRRSAGLVAVLLASGQASAQTTTLVEKNVDKVVGQVVEVGIADGAGSLFKPAPVVGRASKMVLLFEDMLGPGQNDWDYNDAVVATKSEAFDCTATGAIYGDAVASTDLGGDTARKARDGTACESFFQNTAPELETLSIDVAEAREMSATGGVLLLQVQQLATGAGYVHGLKERIKFDGSWIAYVNHTFADGTQSVERYDGYGVLDVPLYDTHEVFEAGTYVNTVGSTGYTSPLKGTRLLVFAEGPSAVAFANTPGPWDLYLALPWLDFSEIHRLSVSGQTEVTSEPAMLVDRDLPFVLEAPGSLVKWPCEGVPIWNVFPRFIDEVLLGGNPGDVVSDPSSPSLTWAVGGNPTCTVDGRPVGTGVILCDPGVGSTTCGVPGDETTSYAFDFDSESKVKDGDATADVMKAYNWQMLNGALQAPSGYKPADVNQVFCSKDDGRTYTADEIPFNRLAQEVYCVLTADGSVVRLVADQDCCQEIRIRYFKSNPVATVRVQAVTDVPRTVVGNGDGTFSGFENNAAILTFDSGFGVTDAISLPSPNARFGAIQDPLNPGKVLILEKDGSFFLFDPSNPSAKMDDAGTARTADSDAVVGMASHPNPDFVYLLDRNGGSETRPRIFDRRTSTFVQDLPITLVESDGNVIARSGSRLIIITQPGLVGVFDLDGRLMETPVAIGQGFLSNVDRNIVGIQVRTLGEGDNGDLIVCGDIGCAVVVY